MVTSGKTWLSVIAVDTTQKISAPELESGSSLIS